MKTPVDQLTPQALVGIDVGGTKCAAGLVRLPDGSVLARRLQPTHPERGGRALLADVAELARSLIAQALECGVEPSAVGVAVAELVDAAGHVLSGATIDWQGVNVQAEIGASIGLPVRIEADVRAAASAEARFGAGRDYRTFLYVTVGTGISACLVLDGVPYVGARGLTGTFASGRGLFPLDGDRLGSGPPLEQFAAGPSLAARLAAVQPQFTGTAREVLALAESGDCRATAVVSSAGQALGAAVGQLVNMLDPQAVVLGGGLGSTQGAFRQAVELAMREGIWSDLHRDLPLASAHLGDDSALVGAALSAANLSEGLSR